MAAPLSHINLDNLPCWSQDGPQSLGLLGSHGLSSSAESSGSFESEMASKGAEWAPGGPRAPGVGIWQVGESSSQSWPRQASTYHRVTRVGIL